MINHPQESNQLTLKQELEHWTRDCGPMYAPLIAVAMFVWARPYLPKLTETEVIALSPDPRLAHTHPSRNAGDSEMRIDYVWPYHF